MRCHAFRYTNASSWFMQTNLLLICHSDRFQRMLSSSAGNYSIATPSEHQHSSHELTTRNQPEKKAAVLWTPAVIHAIRAAAKQGTLFGLSFPHVVGTKTILGGGHKGVLLGRSSDVSLAMQVAASHPLEDWELSQRRRQIGERERRGCKRLLKELISGRIAKGNLRIVTWWR